MRTILAFDTATEYCSATFVCEGTVNAEVERLPRAHNKHLLAMIDRVLDGTPLDGVDVIACGIGPGSFTGLRIAVSVAQGLAWSREIPLQPFCSLEAQLRAAVAADLVPTSGRVLSTLDAQIGQLYWRWFEYGESHFSPMGPPQLSAADAVSFPNEPTAIIGNGIHLLDVLVGFSDIPRVGEVELCTAPMARHLAQSPESTMTLKAGDLMPRYVQDTVGWKKLTEQGSRD
ncbi:tRNA (adenosine(37)-N6)-threonylcarbamoyltransferase complex dimerization subunit type 1 TsaB [Luminiphilus syltensis]|uniref:tRNA (adenosine(37)-N6)-threonylcarbamoyltransferase complex dimerization subunit type 1 TsaB n=1 Tax=Luminiphilus syltensis TaxID=1341119 RepID=UPI00067FC6AF|nr:tRNA (adenosine(37)-N6)-threonylcarbamoyltransferase complex dimerization subunit type 1 TsaB [Luminiphilus syltensis]